MKCQLPTSGDIRTLVLSVAVLASWPIALTAETVTIRNDSQVALVVQCAYVVNGAVKRDKPVVIRAGAAVPIATLTGAKLITVSPASMPNKVLHQSTIPGSKDDQAYILAPNAAGTRIDLEPVKPGGGVAPGGGAAPEEKTKPAPEPPKSGLPPK
jgi:hypothetical protein